ncbi:MAG: DUF4359 domain-containing protein [Methylococcales bacterium]
MYLSGSRQHYIIITYAIHSQKDPLVNVVGSLFSGVATNFVIQQTMREDFVLFSTYDTQFGDEHLKVIGLFNNFYITEKSGVLEKNFQ